MLILLLLLLTLLFQWEEGMGRLWTLNDCRFIIDITQPPVPVALNLSQGQGMIDEEGEGRGGYVWMGSRGDH